MRVPTLVLVLVLVSFLPSVLARCTEEDDCHYSAEAPRPEEGSGEASSAGSDGTTVYGASTWAYAGASWSSHQDGRYKDVSYDHACGSGSDSCTEADGCSGVCYSYWADTWAYVRGNPDAKAHVGGGSS